VTALTEITGKLNELGREVIFLGDGVPVNEEALRDEMKVPYLIAPAHLNRQRAASTAVRAAQIYAEKGEEALVSADDFRPEYLRVSQAERERGDKRNYKVFI
jgi:tRNA threonylcarbamoyladenosine biosynthesis protein TsaB